MFINKISQLCADAISGANITNVQLIEYSEPVSIVYRQSIGRCGGSLMFVYRPF